MRYLVKKIASPDLLTTCQLFEINYPLWNTTMLPHTYGYLGLIPDNGFYLRMMCEESNPLRIHTNANAPVFEDSAMEFFLQLSSNNILSPIYLNLEMNANGALLGMYGANREKRNLFSIKEIKSCDCKATLHELSWNIELHIPILLLDKIYGNYDLEDGALLALNFYKVSENLHIEHYGSFSPINSEYPNFHLPKFFASGKVM